MLLAAFEPFGGGELNSSLEVLGRLEGGGIPGVELFTRVLPTEFGAAPRTLLEEIRHTSPGVVVCLGQARGRAAVTPEQVAINVAHAREQPDNAGERPEDEPVVPGGPAAYFSTLPVREIEAELQRNGLPSAISYTAGTFVCNAVFYALMHALANHYPRTRGGFVHLPVLPEQAPEGDTPTMPLDNLVRATQLATTVAARHRTVAPAP